MRPLERSNHSNSRVLWRLLLETEPDEPSRLSIERLLSALFDFSVELAGFFDGVI